MKRGKKKKKQQAANKTSPLVQSHIVSRFACHAISAFSCAVPIGYMRSHARRFCVFFVFLIVSIVESQQRSCFAARRREFFTWKSGFFRYVSRMPCAFQEHSLSIRYGVHAKKQSFPPALSAKKSLRVFFILECSSSLPSLGRKIQSISTLL